MRRLNQRETADVPGSFKSGIVLNHLLLPLNQYTPKRIKKDTESALGLNIQMFELVARTSTFPKQIIKKFCLPGQAVSCQDKLFLTFFLFGGKTKPKSFILLSNS